MIKKNNCNKKIIKLYSSVNLSTPVDKNFFCKNEFKKYKRLKTLIYFLGEYKSHNKPNIYFKAKILLNSNIITCGNSKKYNIIIKDICFKNEFNVSECSITNEYQYLYDISCSSADNIKKNSCSSNLSLSEIINNGIEKQITNNLRNFIESNAFIINWNYGIGTYILDTTKFNNGKTFPNVKMLIKNKPYNYNSSSSSKLTSCTLSSSSHKFTTFIKILILVFVTMFIILILFKFMPNININKYLSLKKLLNFNKNVDKNVDKKQN